VISELIESGKLKDIKFRPTSVAIFNMRTELQAKFLQHLNTKQSEKGFTLVELLVVIIIIGILAAIALPNFLNQGAKAKQTEARQIVGMTNRIQTVYRSENDSFANTFDKLALGPIAGTSSIASTSNYSYSLSATVDNATLVATSKDTALKSYSGGNNRYTNSDSKSVIASVICEAVAPGTAAAVLSIVNSSSSGPICPASGYQQLGA
jgi:type IV pilus assembly protein PilA